MADRWGRLANEAAIYDFTTGISASMRNPCKGLSLVTCGISPKRIRAMKANTSNAFATGEANEITHGTRILLWVLTISWPLTGVWAQETRVAL
jgi:hypothetical protein